MILLNGCEIKPTIFPDKTSQVWQIDNNYFSLQGRNVVEWRFENEAEFMHLAQLKTLLDTLGDCKLILPYLPYGRQDKIISNQATFALRTFINLLRSLNFYAIFVVDPHSNLIVEQLNNVTVLMPDYAKLLGDLRPDYVCYPDKGALNKYAPLIKCAYFHGEKVRDQASSHITSYKLQGITDYEMLQDTNILIVDDLCDGGATFVILAKQLLEYGVKSVSLFVTHGLFTKGLKPLKDAGIDHIYVYDAAQPRGYKEL